MNPVVEAGDIHIDKYDFTSDAKIKALNDSKRRAILGILYLHGPKSSSELAHYLEVKPNELAYHLGVLKEGGYIDRAAETDASGRACAKYSIAQEGIRILDKMGAKQLLDVEFTKNLTTRTPDFQDFSNRPKFQVFSPLLATKDASMLPLSLETDIARLKASVDILSKRLSAVEQRSSSDFVDQITEKVVSRLRSQFAVTERRKLSINYETERHLLGKRDEAEEKSFLMTVPPELKSEDISKFYRNFPYERLELGSLERTSRRK